MPAKAPKMAAFSGIKKMAAVDEGIVSAFSPIQKTKT